MANLRIYWEGDKRNTFTYTHIYIYMYMNDYVYVCTHIHVCWLSGSNTHTHTQIYSKIFVVTIHTHIYIFIIFTVISLLLLLLSLWAQIPKSDLLHCTSLHFTSLEAYFGSTQSFQVGHFSCYPELCLRTQRPQKTKTTSNQTEVSTRTQQHKYKCAEAGISWSPLTESDHNDPNGAPL